MSLLSSILEDLLYILRVIPRYRPSVSLSSLCGYLGFKDEEECKGFLVSAGGIVDEEKGLWLTTESVDKIAPFEPPKVYEEDSDSDEDGLGVKFRTQQ